MASDYKELVQEAISVIEDAGLPYPSGPLLSSFVSGALNPRLAAEYVLQASRSQAHSDEANPLLSLLADWKYIVEAVSTHATSPPSLNAAIQAAIAGRDGARCCITGKPGSIRDKLIVTYIMPVPLEWIKPDNPRIFQMLGAFFTPPYRDWWLAYARDPERLSPHSNHWLVRKSAVNTFRQGLVKLDRLQPSMVEYEVKDVFIGLKHQLGLNGHYPLLGDHSRLGISKVDARFLGTHARLCSSIRWLAVIDHMASNEKVPPLRRFNSTLQSIQAVKASALNALQTVLFFIWRRFPRRIRVKGYQLLSRLGMRLYGPTNSSSVQRLPFGMYLKRQNGVGPSCNEYNALSIVRQNTTVPVPKPLDLMCVPACSAEITPSEDSYLLTTCVSGTPLSACCEMLSDRDILGFVVQMQDYLNQLRAINPPTPLGSAICNTLGGPCYDSRIRDGNPVGPFADEEAFSQLHRNPNESTRRGHKIMFTHADLNFRNILVDEVDLEDGTRGWRVKGIVDWEFSGYYPEYWEYTKAMFEGFRLTERMQGLVHEVFQGLGDYSEEFQIEKKSWEEGDYI
ncbi:hypothetical protein G7046_g998 [Stylonectria norvegica]|nr:hypothetical protein G7046_g998 [Stylonectria norvegica]